ncbi:hypothetical protein [Streptomyces rimosus]|uniref:hypothetical protein n=1 Tax=Streptomyces rimosus TaxID=1927 RepID=UPI00131B9293|nr:hypothetical protein [Streptomyces rimosus]
MTYRAGVWVFDRANGQVGKVLRDGEGPGRVLITSASGIAWQAEAVGLRLATPAERASADDGRVEG